MEDPLLEAPELSKDDRSDNGFVNWFKALNQVDPKFKCLMHCAPHRDHCAE